METSLKQFDSLVTNRMQSLDDRSLTRFWAGIGRAPIVRDWDILRAMIFLGTSFPLGLAWFLVAVIGGSVGAMLAIIGVGLLLIAMTVGLLVTGARIDRARLRELMKADVALSLPRAQAGASLPRRAWLRARDAQTWRDVAYILLLFPIGIVELFVLVLPFDLVLSPIAAAMFGSADWLWWDINNGFEVLVSGVLGVLLLPLFMILMQIVAGLHVRFGEALLGSETEETLRERVDELAESRSAIMKAMHLERKRIERDLHDGAQQQLVSLAMDLGRAVEKIDTDPNEARAILVDCHEKSKDALSEMRNLVRGIHPAVLTDRGLDAAISAIAGRSPIPVHVDINVGGRMPEEVEGTAYFVVAEALTNVARHSGATRVGVQIQRDQDYLYVQVTDNGHGGAAAMNGSGLRGLDDRIRALDGIMAVTSPQGQGTRVEVRIPFDPDRVG